MATQLVPENLNVTGARLPAAYEKACAALVDCASIDECQTWANKAAALASYARQADDDTLQKQAMRIQSRAVRRCGELLKEVKSQGARNDLAVNDVSSLPDAAVPKSATAAARAAGMSERQQKTAMRVASVPAAHFEAAVESDEPPTVTKLADMGRHARSQPAEPPPGFSAAIQFGGHVRRLAEFAKQFEAGFVGSAVPDYDRREMRSHIAQCRRLFDQIGPHIRESRDEL